MVVNQQVVSPTGIVPFRLVLLFPANSVGFPPRQTVLEFEKQGRNADWYFPSAALRGATYGAAVDDRDELKRVLQGLLDDVVDEPADAYILKRAISALRRLDDGEVDALFAPTKKASWGHYPARVRQIQAWAAFWVSRLVDMGETATEAENQIADAMVVSPEAIHKWRTNLNKSPTSYLTEIIAHAAENGKLLENLNIVTSPNKAAILSAAQSLGQEFKKAREKKSVSKS